MRRFDPCADLCVYAGPKGTQFNGRTHDDVQSLLLAMGLLVRDAEDDREQACQILSAVAALPHCWNVGFRLCCSATLARGLQTDSICGVTDAIAALLERIVSAAGDDVVKNPPAEQVALGCL